MVNEMWPGVIDTTQLSGTHVAAVNRMSDAAKSGTWGEVVEIINSSSWISANQWRIEGRSWFAPLHQAAWHGAPVEVASRLIELGGWRSLRDAEGKRPIDIAEERGHTHLREVLAVAVPTPVEQLRYAAWDQHLSELIASRTQLMDPVAIRPVQTEVIVAENLDLLSFLYPGMYGGFTMSVHRLRLFVESSSRVAGGSGQAHVITEGGCVLVEEGFV